MMRVFDLRESSRDGAAFATARMLPDGGDAPLEIRFRVEGLDGPLSGLGDALAVGMLTPAMFEGETLAIEGPVSRTLLENLERAQEVLTTWYDYLAPVKVVPGEVTPASAAKRTAGVASCFTGGVDSWYSLLKHRSRVSHLLLVRGFDIGLDNDELWEATRARTQGVAARMGKQLITCTTNLRLIADKRRSGWGRKYDADFWGRCLHGAALAAVALTLGEDVSELIVPASHKYDNIFPWGSSPLLDPWWSNGRVAITHDGCEAGRLSKTRRLAANQLALQTLRVCYADTSSYNCGRCEKCLRTMMSLRACGALERVRTFSTPLDLARVHRLRVPSQARYYYEEIAAAARANGDHALWRAAQVAIGESFSLRHTMSMMRQAAANTAWARALKGRGAAGAPEAVALSGPVRPAGSSSTPC